MENWNFYKSDIGRFWLGELDTDKRESVVEIVWNHIEQIMKKICIVDELTQQLPVHRHLLKLKRRLLANHGQPLWDACQNRHRYVDEPFFVFFKIVFVIVHGNRYFSKVQTSYRPWN